MFDFPIPINDRILGAYHHRSCYGGVRADDQRFLSADAEQTSIFVPAAYYCNGFPFEKPRWRRARSTARNKAFTAILTKCRLSIDCTWPIAPYMMRSKGLEHVASHAAGAAFSFVTPPSSRACRAMGQGCDLQQALTISI